jgi:glycerol-3-phosphate dehydrogenase (NAD(P)+)
MKATVVGSGNMGTAMACLMAMNGRQVTCWDHIPEVVEDIRKNHENRRYLPGFQLPSGVGAEMILERAVREARVIVVAVPSPYFRQVVKGFSPFAPSDAVVVGCAKGLEAHSGKRMSQVYAEAASHDAERYVALSGPSVAGEFVWGKPTAVAAAGRNEACLQKAVQVLTTPFFRVAATDDLPGVEWGGVLKNVYAIGMGFIDGLSPGAVNVKAAFLEMALREMRGLGVRLGARPETLDGLAGLGDLVTTGFSPDSHNRRLGESLALGKSFEDAIDHLGGGLPEGVKTAAILADLVAKMKAEAPIALKVDACVKHPAGIPKFLEDIWRTRA